MVKNNKKPRLRFKGFTDEWEQRKFKYWFDERNERSGNGELISVTINSGIKKFNELNRFDSKPSDMSNYKVVCKGDIAYNSMRMWQGASGISPYTGILSPAYTVISPKSNTSSLFFSFQIKRPQMIHKFEINSQGLTKDTWNLKFAPFSQIETSAPKSLEEQTKIGDFFYNLDNLITLHQRKYDKLLNVKKALLDKMFSKNQEKTPKIRFKGFFDAWEQRKLGEIAQITMGQSPDGSTYSDKPLDYILVQGNADLVDGWVYPRIWTSQKTKTCQVGDLIMSVRAPAGSVGKTLYNAVIGRGVAAIKGNEFLFQNLVKMDNDSYWKLLSCGSTFESLNSDNIKNAKIKIPSEIEQTKIGDFFYNLDNLITLHQSKCEKLKNIKKALLDKMFV